ncbi:MAG: 50S ribosomal protein L20 [Chloroflexota bacterium]
MTRVKRGVTAHARHKKILTQAKGYFHGRRKLHKTANETVMRALANSFRHRRERKRDFHRLWIMRINAAARLEGITYSQLMFALKTAGIEMDRKVLADMALRDVDGFKAVVTQARAALPATA